MPKIMTVQISVPSGSRPEKFKVWLGDHLRAHRMEVISVEERERPKLQSLDDFFKEVEDGGH